MSTNPFDNERGSFHVVVNHLGQHSLWPTSADAPAGWHAAFGPDTRAACIEFVDTNWTDLRPQRKTAAARDH